MINGKTYLNKKPNWKINIFLYIPFLALFFIIINGGMIGAMISAVLAYVPVRLIIKIFRIDPYVYYGLDGKSITREEYEKLDNKVEYEHKGFKWFSK